MQELASLFNFAFVDYADLLLIRKKVHGNDFEDFILKYKATSFVMVNGFEVDP